MKKREHKATSSTGHEFIKPHKPSHRERIKEALEKGKVGLTHEEIAELSGLRPDQVWKRLSEASRDGEIFDTGLTRKLKSGVPGIVWQLTNIPKPTSFTPTENLKEWFNKYQNEPTNDPPYQPELF
jgi:hypothetical protein